MIRYEFIYVYFIATKNVGDYSYMSSPNIYYRAFLLYSLYKTDLIGPLIKGQKNRGNTEYRPGKNFTVYCLVLIILHNFIPIVNYITIGFFSNIICIKTLYNISVNNMKT